MKRVITAVIMAPLAACVALWAPGPLLLAVVACVALLSFQEFCGLVAGHGIEEPGPAAYAAGLLILLLRPESTLAVTLLAALAIALALSSRSLEKVLPRAAAMLLGIIYIFGAWRCALLLRAQSPHWLLFALALNWVGDTAAYYAGRLLGRHKLAARISPAKSWEGSIASLAASILFGWLYCRAFLPAAPAFQVLALGALGNIAGQVGDLAESALKRGAGVKDSSALLPGHGGWLDRTDSHLFTLPVIYGLLSAPWPW